MSNEWKLGYTLPVGNIIIEEGTDTHYIPGIELKLSKDIVSKSFKELSGGNIVQPSTGEWKAQITMKRHAYDTLSMLLGMTKTTATGMTHVEEDITVASGANTLTDAAYKIFSVIEKASSGEGMNYRIITSAASAGQVEWNKSAELTFYSSSWTKEVTVIYDKTNTSATSIKMEASPRDMSPTFGLFADMAHVIDTENPDDNYVAIEAKVCAINGEIPVVQGKAGEDPADYTLDILIQVRTKGDLTIYAKA